MERTMIAFNVPNFFTVMIMAVLGYGLVFLVRQLMLRTGAGPSVSPTSQQLGGF